MVRAEKKWEQEQPGNGHAGTSGVGQGSLQQHGTGQAGSKQRCNANPAQGDHQGGLGVQARESSVPLRAGCPRRGKMKPCLGEWGHSAAGSKESRGELLAPWER